METIENNQEINKIIEESKKDLINSEMENKKGRGRPKKTVGVTSNNVNPNNTILSPSVVAPIRPTIYKPTIQALYKMSGGYLNDLTHSKVWDLEKDELLALTDATDDVCADFIPMSGGVNDKWARLILLITSISTIYGSKYFAMIKEKEKINHAEKIEPIESTTTN